MYFVEETSVPIVRVPKDDDEGALLRSATGPNYYPVRNAKLKTNELKKNNKSGMRLSVVKSARQ